MGKLYLCNKPVKGRWENSTSVINPSKEDGKTGSKHHREEGGRGEGEGDGSALLSFTHGASALKWFLFCVDLLLTPYKQKKAATLLCSANTPFCETQQRVEKQVGEQSIQRQWRTTTQADDEVPIKSD